MRSMRFAACLVAILAVALARAGEVEKKAEPGKAAEAGEKAEAAKKQEPPKKSPHLPLPLHTIEGTSGVFITDTAYFANLPEGDAILGKPSVAFSAARLGHGRHLEAYTVTTTIFKRFEVGYSQMRFGVGDWADDVRHATGIRVPENVRLHTFSLRGMVIREGEWGLPWMPAITAGVRYKHNDDIWHLDRHLFGTCRWLGVRDNDGVEGTLTASKTFVGVLPKPFILSAGLRNTDAAGIGLLGFTHDRTTVFECSAVFFVTDKLLLAAEFRQKPDQLKRVPGLVGREDNWWTVALGYIVSPHCMVAAGLGQFGNILNRHADLSPAIQVKWEF